MQSERLVPDFLHLSSGWKTGFSLSRSRTGYQRNRLASHPWSLFFCSSQISFCSWSQSLQGTGNSSGACVTVNNMPAWSCDQEMAKICFPWQTGLSVFACYEQPNLHHQACNEHSWGGIQDIPSVENHERIRGEKII